MMQDSKKLQRAFSLAVRRARERLDVSQDKLAELADLHRTYIGSVERGERNVSLINISVKSCLHDLVVDTVLSAGYNLSHVPCESNFTRG